MDKSLIEQYIEEMRQMSKRAMPTNQALPPESSLPTPPPDSAPLKPNGSEPPPSYSGQGYLVVNVTSVRGLYPVEGAKITVFSGSLDDKTVLFTDYTNQSGKTILFTLPAPPASLAQESENDILPYSYYNILTEADGFVPTVNYNVAIFDGITSLQSVNMLPKTPQNEGDTTVVDEKNNYNL